MRNRRGSYKVVVARCAACGGRRGETFYVGEFTWFDCSVCHKETRIGRSI